MGRAAIVNVPMICVTPSIGRYARYINGKPDVALVSDVPLSQAEVESFRINPAHLLSQAAPLIQEPA